MNYKRKLTIVLLISFVNLIASPFLLASRSTAVAAPFDGPTEFIRRINLTTNDLVYSSTTGKLYASVPSSSGTGGNSITAIDPATGLITSSTFIGSEPNKLALSDDGHNLYVTLEGAFAIRRFDALTNTPGIQFSPGVDSFFGRFFVNDFAVAPGHPETIAVSRWMGLSPPEAGVAVFDDGVRRPNVGPGHTSGADFLAFSASATKLYGTGDFSGVQTITLDASGVSVSSPAVPGVAGRIKFSNGLLFTSNGQVVNPDTSSLLGTFDNASTQGTSAFVPDTAAGRAYYLQFSAPGTLILKAFDINTFLQLGSLQITGVEGNPSSLVRWGANGLAFRTTGNQLFVIQTSLIPSAEPIPTPTPTPSPSPSPSPSPAAPAFIRQMPLNTNDLVYNQSTQKIYASVPSIAGNGGNSIAEIDPVAGSVTNRTFMGSEPNHLAQGDDGATLYVSLDGASAIRRYNMLTHTAGDQFFLGGSSIFGNFSVSDIAVSPGNPSVVAAALQTFGFSPSEQGVAIFDGGVLRPKTGPGHVDGSDILAFASPSVLYGAAFQQDFTKYSIDSSGVTVTATAPFQSGQEMVLANNLLYGSSGQVLNPSTGDLVGSFAVGNGGVFQSSHVIDVANGRAFFLISQFINGQGLNVQIKAYDLNTFLPVGFIDITGINGGPGNLVRWGTNGLAFTTFDGKVYLIESPLVNASVPIASPTPTPSPTPSPTPPYIPSFVRRVDLPANNLVYSEATQALYASVPSSAGANGNSITKITPATGEIGPSVFVGSEPNKLAISSDGQTIWTHLNGANAARRFDVMTGTAGVQFTTGIQAPVDMEVVPGSPQSLVLSKGFSTGVSVFDNGVQRPNSVSFFNQIEFGATPSVLYGVSGNEIQKFLVDSSGVTQPSLTGKFWSGGNSAKFSDGLMYGTSGAVADPESGEPKGTFQGAGFFSIMAVHGPNKRTFFAAVSDSSNVVIRAFDSNTFVPIGSVTLPGVFGTPVSLVRWGTNGLAFTTIPTTSPGTSKVYLLQTELVSNAAPIPTGIQLETDKFFAFENSQTATVKVSRTGDVSGTVSVNYATSDGTATAGSDYTATSGTLTFAPGELSKNISIPILDDNVFENGNETFNVTLSGPTGGAILTAPNQGTISIGDNEFKPFLSASSPVNIIEGDSGTKNAVINLTLNNPTVQTVTVDYATVNGTATAGSDYVATSGTITMPPGTTSASINVVINGDTTVEPNETFTVMLTNATNVNFVSNANVTVAIANDDATLQFSNAKFSVNEGAGFVFVTVTRLGANKAASVSYATTDTAGLQNCTLANGKASERCDYATSVGLLQFGVFETSKNILIPIVDDALVEGDETLTVNLSGAGGALLGTPSTATITIVDNDSTPATQNPIDGVTPFITQQYIDFLGRLPDSIGLANWIDTLGNCPNGGFGEFDNPTCDRVHVSSGFFLSEEFRGRGYWAYKFYEVGFDRRPLYTEFVPDMAQVGGPQSPESEAISKAAYMDAFVQRPEFKNRYDSLSNSAYVDALETNAEVTLTNKAALVAALDGNQKTRAQVLREIVELQSVDDKFFIRAFVAMQYFGYLRRDPDTIGYNNWVTTLTADPSNSRHMIFGFIFSDEYRHRFGP